MFDTKYDIEIIKGYPALINWNEKIDIVENAIKRSSGISLINDFSTMVSEDFAYYLEKVPGCFIWLGVRGLNETKQYPLHHYLFDIDEDAIAIGLKVYWSIYIEEMKYYEQNK